MSGKATRRSAIATARGIGAWNPTHVVRVFDRLRAGPGQGNNPRDVYWVATQRIGRSNAANKARTQQLPERRRRADAVGSGPQIR
jgi:hypothetical protein